jgi:hypothetical protein
MAGQVVDATAAGTRTIAASTAVMVEFAEHLRRRGLTAQHGEAWVFQAPEGGLLRYSVFRSRVWTPEVTEAGPDGVSFHNLRHSRTHGWRLGSNPRQRNIGSATRLRDLFWSCTRTPQATVTVPRPTSWATVCSASRTTIRRRARHERAIVE